MPLLVIVMVWGGLVEPTSRLPKIKLVADREIAGALMPRPVSETARGLPVALSLMVMAPLRVPAAVGPKTTRIAQLAELAKPLPQLLVWAKSPVAAMLVMVKGAVPVLVSVTVCEVLVVPMGWLAKFKALGERVTVTLEVTVVVTVAVLSSGLGSNSVAFTLAELVSVPAVVGVTTIVTVALQPSKHSRPRLQTTIAVPLQLALGVEETNVTPAGKVSVRVTPVASDGPLLVTVIV